MSTLVPAANTLAKLIGDNKNQLAQIAAKSLDIKRLARIAIMCVNKTPALHKCSPESVLRSVMQAAELGLEPGSALGEAYLVPYGSECTLIPGYRGLITLARRSGEVQSVTAHCVYEGDEFHFKFGLEAQIDHVPADTDRSAAKMTHAYCVIKLKDGGLIYDVMTKKEIDAIRARSKAGNSGPWVTDYSEMARKTVVKRTLKYAPMSVEMSRAIALDTASETGDRSVLAEFSDLAISDEELMPSLTTKTDKVKSKIPPVPEDEAPEAPAADTETGEVAEPSEPEPDYTVDEDGLKRSKSTGRLID